METIERINRILVYIGRGFNNIFPYILPDEHHFKFISLKNLEGEVIPPKYHILDLGQRRNEKEQSSLFESEKLKCVARCRLGNGEIRSVGELENNFFTFIDSSYPNCVTIAKPEIRESTHQKETDSICYRRFYPFFFSSIEKRKEYEIVEIRRIRDDLFFVSYCSEMFKRFGFEFWRIWFPEQRCEIESRRNGPIVSNELDSSYGGFFRPVCCTVNPDLVVVKIGFSFQVFRRQWAGILLEKKKWKDGGIISIKPSIRKQIHSFCPLNDFLNPEISSSLSFNPIIPYSKKLFYFCRKTVTEIRFPSGKVGKIINLDDDEEDNIIMNIVQVKEDVVFVIFKKTKGRYLDLKKFEWMNKEESKNTCNNDLHLPKKTSSMFAEEVLFEGENIIAKSKSSKIFWKSREGIKKKNKKNNNFFVIPKKSFGVIENWKLVINETREKELVKDIRDRSRFVMDRYCSEQQILLNNNSNKGGVINEMIVISGGFEKSFCIPKSLFM